MEDSSLLRGVWEYRLIDLLYLVPWVSKAFSMSDESFHVCVPRPERVNVHYVACNNT